MKCCRKVEGKDSGLPLPNPNLLPAGKSTVILNTKRAKDDPQTCTNGRVIWRGMKKLLLFKVYLYFIFIFFKMECIWLFSWSQGGGGGGEMIKHALLARELAENFRPLLLYLFITGRGIYVFSTGMITQVATKDSEISPSAHLSYVENLHKQVAQNWHFGGNGGGDLSAKQPFQPTASYRVPGYDNT